MRAEQGNVVLCLLIALIIALTSVHGLMRDSLDLSRLGREESAMQRRFMAAEQRLRELELAAGRDAPAPAGPPESCTCVRRLDTLPDGRGLFRVAVDAGHGIMQSDWLVTGHQQGVRVSWYWQLRDQAVCPCWK
ncbi:hypothetical protein [Paludibacterium paludis]|uniref:hypothetical protein n=1 Tax=Paludibacterium paludis TaxID=1225769 RepID=UPI001673FE62|nr:hypothetical protein [Paludibacterium paludis]